MRKEKLILATLILVLTLLVYLTGTVLPQVSSALLISLFLAFYTWLWTLSMVHKKRMERKFPRSLNMDWRPTVNIVIPAHNEANVIAGTVKDMLGLDYPDFEVLVMDDRSTDGTGEALKKLAEELDDPRFRYHIRPNDAFPGKSAVLNDALAITGGEVVAVFDADARVEPDFLAHILPHLADINVGAVQARKVIANASANWLTRCQNYEYSMDSHYQTGRSSIYGAVELRGNGQLIKRQALEEVGGWNEYTLTDDLDLSTRLHLSGWDVRFAHKVLVYEEGITRFGALVRQRKRWSEGSLVRYLENAGSILTSDRVSLRTTLDMLVYLIQFLMPLWISLDLLHLLWEVVDGDPGRVRILSSLVILPFVATFTMGALIVAIIRFNRPFEKSLRSVWHVAWWSVVTGVYMTFIWCAITLLMIGKTLFQENDERRVEWAKTEHFGHGHQSST